jgi:hypothetical protein
MKLSELVRNDVQWIAGISVHILYDVPAIAASQSGNEIFVV